MDTVQSENLNVDLSILATTEFSGTENEWWS